jgi:hypothetical protein
MTAPIPFVTHPQRLSGGGPRILTGKHHENQKNKKRTNSPRKTKARDIPRDLPPVKYTANMPTTIEKRLNISINIAIKK